MNELSKEYAQSLFTLGVEENRQNEYSEALNTVCDVFRENPEYFLLMSSPDIPDEEKNRLLNEAFSDFIPEYVTAFLKLLCEKHHINELFDCNSHYSDLLKAFEKISEARIISAVPLTDSEKEKIVKKLEAITKHKVLAVYEQDSTFLGGLKIYIDGNIIDGTVKYELSKVKEALL